MTFQVPPSSRPLFFPRPLTSLLSVNLLLALEAMKGKRDLCPIPLAASSDDFPASDAGELLVTGLADGDELVVTPDRGPAVTATIVAGIHEVTAPNVGTFAAVTAGHQLSFTVPAIPGLLPDPLDFNVQFAGTEASLADYLVTFAANPDFSFALTASDNGGKLKIESNFGGSGRFTIHGTSLFPTSDADVLASLGYTHGTGTLLSLQVGATPNVANTQSIDPAELAALLVAAGIDAYVGAGVDPTKQRLVLPDRGGRASAYSGAIATALELDQTIHSSRPGSPRPILLRQGRRLATYV
jgi:hypothetical protein